MNGYKNGVSTLSSKLEVCVAIIKFLDQKGPQTSGKIEVSITAKADMVRKCLDLLTKQRLLEKRTNHNNIETYANTEPSKRVLEFFHVKVQLQAFRKINGRKS
jgi:hypothetical protein